MIRFDGTSWSHDREAPGGVHGIGETADGTLWTGTSVLNRFDGQAWPLAERVPVELTRPYLGTLRHFWQTVAEVQRLDNSVPPGCTTARDRDHRFSGTGFPAG